jgi:sensor domain CHASE-containing protein
MSKSIINTLAFLKLYWWLIIIVFGMAVTCKSAIDVNAQEHCAITNNADRVEKRIDGQQGKIDSTLIYVKAIWMMRHGK